MRRGARRVAVTLVATAVLATGVGYALTRQTTWEAHGSVYLVPSVEDPFTRSTLLDAFQRSGTIGTYVELLTSETLRARASARDIGLRVSAVPDSRVISLRASGNAKRVQTGLAALQRAALEPEAQIGDGWELRLGQPASAPLRRDTATHIVVLAAVMLAALAALVASVLLERLFPPPVAVAPARSAEDEAPADVYGRYVRAGR